MYSFDAKAELLADIILQSSVSPDPSFWSWFVLLKKRFLLLSLLKIVTANYLCGNQDMLFFRKRTNPYLLNTFLIVCFVWIVHREVSEWRGIAQHGCPKQDHAGHAAAKGRALLLGRGGQFRLSVRTLRQRQRRIWHEVSNRYPSVFVKRKCRHTMVAKIISTLVFSAAK